MELIDLRPMVMTAFVLLQSDWPVVRGRELVEALLPTHVIVQRHDPQEYYYLYPSQEVLDRLRRAPDTTPIWAALNLHETDATPLVDIHADPLSAPNRCVVEEEGRLVGFYDASIRGGETLAAGAHLPSLPSIRRGDMVLEGPGVAPLPSLPSRALVARFPERVALDEVTSLLVSLSTTDGGSGSIPIGELVVGTILDILVQAERGFVLEGRGEGQLKISDGQLSLPLQFKLRSTALGPGQIVVLAFHDGLCLGKMTLTPTVIEPSLIPRTTSSRGQMQPLAPVSVQLPNPDLLLFIEQTQVNDRPAITLLISATDPRLNMSMHPFEPIVFHSDPGRYFEEFYRDIENYAVETPEDKVIAAENLADKGTLLFQTLIPPEAQRTLWSLKDQIKTVLVQSAEPWIPWELCKLCGQDNGQEGPFFAEAFAMTRWMLGPGFKPTLTLQNLALVVPSDSRLPLATAERDYLLSLAQSPRQVTPIPARFKEVHEALASGQYDGWHFTGHGGYRASDPNRSAIYLEQQVPFTPENLVGKVAHLGKAHPLVFLNACQVGQGGMSLTDIGGWAKRFLDAGAGAFIGPYWSVYDQSACTFAQEVYSRLLAGLPIGQAVQQARLAIRQTGDLTWLAYTVFAHPFMTILS